MNIIRGLTFYFLIIIGGAASVILLCPSILLLLVYSVRVIRWKRIYINAISGLFFDYTAAVLRYVCGTKVLVYSDDANILSDPDLSLVISNHRCRLDWMYVGKH
jgi:1-acyl-sn-glycerol-3-phosphate acyltransferase